MKFKLISELNLSGLSIMPKDHPEIFCSKKAALKFADKVTPNSFYIAGITITRVFKVETINVSH